ncbi:UDP-2,4-diacetamido-2,4,6-trideoxy-beta-L-altropyranose hydrolase [Pseudomonas alcaligenes]|jgi:UDP-2,4-diacetamido-2,4,6-trideoxy-beta-L-altropyranose hydrolase|uniref:UDP-2,4-diacetamido-2,4, 6-trideoxy-beta-L-altropyranose hydrolase n=1 Tax=Pseudomonadaceae TaxID=135621 RepID=UPI001472E3E5|nr:MULTISPECIES: UDP-2,4-diacetamido-2,4,6-trideoxy-beta-L-altropyranose hydrolase [Pseudomonas]MEE1949596.1 UDP-2,4-diacetamido-2,4,6-trideoxy-beta-L-altropyranose hydrolase [Pseudomonas alcaligenes]NMY40037.1 UDP-2,4-diacetamido-2,4,6-trideoxy-beta-L-altropyranose hydrolase [Pseudomonas sp. WS 5013]
MKIAFRADASLQMGSGHIMRCVTLADALKQRGAECHFLCRDHPGHLVELVRGKGHVVHVLNCEQDSPIDPEGPAHAAWLGATQEQDVQACLPILQALQPDWLIVDHYALDISWEERLRPFCRRLMVIDDLADRVHQCDMLLDQNLGREPADYAGLVPNDCIVLAGPQYALLRPEFAALREYSLARRRCNQGISQLLITMGGVDLVDASGLVLDALTACDIPETCQITVVMGGAAPWLDRVKAKAAELPWKTRVMVNVSNMAQLMADADLCLGAAGSTSWERCALGLPCILLCLADNQKMVIEALSRKGVAMALDIQALQAVGGSLLNDALTQAWSAAPHMAECAASVTDGSGCTRLMGYLVEVQ